MAVLPSTLNERFAVYLIGLGPIESGALAVARCAVALQVADVSIGGPAAKLQPHDSRLDDDPTHALAPPALPGHELQPIGRPLAPPDPAASTFPGTHPLARAWSLLAHLGRRQRTGVGLDRCGQDLTRKGSRPTARARAAITHAARSRAEVEVVVAGHTPKLAPANAAFKLEPAHLASWR